MMKRFIDLRGQDLGYRFAFFCEGSHCFERFDGSAAWDSFEDFEFDYTDSKYSTAAGLQQYRDITPAWAMTPSKKEDSHLSESNANFVGRRLVSVDPIEGTDSYRLQFEGSNNVVKAETAELLQFCVGSLIKVDSHGRFWIKVEVDKNETLTV